ncbi:hypothetical protein [Rhodopirellula sp. MGV]|uniref:hypothetical protein n=1 Tax=Rhodopirellula sp. MGV TaxID=2023130 RepID=UPI000B9606B6|nr:hypothetical protein [Rhodopirellula sp. MGV]OYP28453.1 hypothetical protein CGZ80_27010 [Rhodopirellula sp. MGV]PNY38669.1 hypothetical protein C2E31_01765 [Rhodopirellula baltica]
MTDTSYSDWPHKFIKITNLRLDPENPRLTTPSPNNEQRAICEEMIEHGNVDKIARDIVGQGFYPTESLVVVNDGGGKYTVLEGNRRTAAIKCLSNPSFAPVAKKSKFEVLKQEGQGRIPTAVRCVVAPSRVAARPIILSKHTKASIERWSPVAQARYIETMVAEGFSAEQIARDMGFKPEEFSRRFRDAKLYSMAMSLDLKPDVQSTVENPNKFNFSVLQRVAESTEGRQWLGLQPDEKAGWKINTKVDDFRKALGKIVTDVAEKKVTTRSLQKTEDMKKYLGNLKSVKPKPKGGRPTTASGVAKKKKPTKTKPNGNGTSAKIAILPKDATLEVDVPRISAIIQEINQVNYQRNPNSVAMLYRSLLDMLAAEYLDSTGRIKDLLTKVDKKGQKPADWMPSLPQMLRFIVKDIPAADFPLQASARRALDRFVDDKTTGVCLSALDGFAHNRHETPNPKQLEDIANRTRPLVAILYRKHS